MISSLFSSLRITLQRLVADWLIVTAAFSTILLATTLLAAGPVYADAVTISALQQTLDDAPVRESNLSIEVSVFPAHYSVADNVVRSTVEDALSATGSDIYIYIEADAYGFDDQPSGDVADVVSFQHVEGIENRATIGSGRWPENAGPPYETAVSVATAEVLDLGVGDRIDVSNRRDDSLGATVEIVGVFDIDDPADPFWFEDPLILQGATETPGIRKLGPFVVTLETMIESFTPLRTVAGWRVLPDYDNLTVPEVNTLRSGALTLEEDLNQEFFVAMEGDTSGSSPFIVQTGLPTLLSGVDRSLTVTRSSVVALLVQLAILAGYALALTAGLLVDTRRTETALLRSRGASPGQILDISIVEGVILTVPAAVAAPFLATWLLRILNTAGPLADVGLTIDPQPTTEAYFLAAFAALLSIVALAWPAYRTARETQGTSSRNRRQESRPVAQRVGLDVALLGLAIVVFWQLETLGNQIGARIRGQFGVDPLLVIAPALGLLAGAVLALRMIPLLARIGERVAAAGRGIIGALASWQVARRPVRYARSSLLLMMAISIGFFAASYATTWITSQRDQANFVVGASVSLVPDRAASGALTDFQLPDAHLGINGVEESMPVNLIRGELARTGGFGNFVLLDAAKADAIVEIREDLSPDFSGLMERLVSARPAMGGVELPGEPEVMALVFDAMETPPEDFEPSGPGFDGRVRAIIQDGDGLLHRVPVSTIRVDRGPRRMVADFRLAVGEGTSLPTYPVRLVNIEIAALIPDDGNHQIELSFLGIQVWEDSVWSDVDFDLDWAGWGVSRSTVAGTIVSPAIATASPATPGAITMEIQSGYGFPTAPVYFSIRPTGTVLPETFPVVVSESFLETGLAAVGDEVSLPPLRIRNDTGLIVGTVESFPTLEPGSGETLIIDLPTLQMMGYEPGFGLGRADQYWLATDGGDDSSIVGTLQAAPFKSRSVMSTEELTDTLVSDPVALGTIGALTVGFVAAAVFAAVGFAVSATVSARERLIEFALIRALGLSPRQLGMWLVLEQGVLVFASLLMGTLIGVVLTATILPLISLTQSGQPAVPDVIVLFPWDIIVVLEVAVVAVLAVIVLAMSVLLRRIGLGSLLRLGED